MTKVSASLVLSCVIGDDLCEKVLKATYIEADKTQCSQSYEDVINHLIFRLVYSYEDGRGTTIQSSKFMLHSAISRLEPDLEVSYYKNSNKNMRMSRAIFVQWL